MDQSETIAALAAENVRLKEVLDSLSQPVNVKVEQVADGYAIGFLDCETVKPGRFLRVESVGHMVRPDDDCRGFGQHHSRINPATDAEFDRLAADSGVYGEPEEPTMQQWEGVLRLFGDLISMGTKRREIFFSRLTGIEWHVIGQTQMNGSTAQAAQKEWAETAAQFPYLAKALKQQKEPT